MLSTNQVSIVSLQGRVQHSELACNKETRQSYQGTHQHITRLSTVDECFQIPNSFNLQYDHDKPYTILTTTLFSI